MPHSARTRRHNKLSLRRRRRARGEAVVPPVAPADAATGLVTQRLSELTGLSPSMERQLYAIGQTRFFQMAHWSDEHIARVADQLGLDEAQIRGANWIGQARRRG